MVPVDEWRKLSEGVERMLMETDLIPLLSKAARKRVESEFSLKRMVTSLEELYTSLAKEAQVADKKLVHANF
jgi:glycosyltransferase involved in cell wall biosynthesis